MVKYFLGFIFFVSTCHSWAETVPLTQKEVAEKILKNSFRSKEAQLNTELYMNDYVKVLSGYDYTISLESSYLMDKTQSPTSTAYLENDTTLNSLKLSKPFVTGTKVTLDYSLARLNPTPNPSSSLASSLIAQTNNNFLLTIEQNLFKNFFGASDRAAINAAELNLESNQILRNNNLQNVVLDGIKLFWKTYVAQENFKESIASRDRYEKLVDIVKRKSSLGYASPGEFSQIQAELETRKQNVKNQSTQYLALSDQLSTLLNIDQNTEFKFIVPEEVPAIPLFQDINPENLRALVSQKKKVDAARESLKSSDWKTYPDISFVGKVGQNGLDTDTNNSFNELYSGVNPQYYLGIKISHSFGSGTQREDYVNKRIQLDLEQTKLERMTREIKDQLDDAKRNIFSTFAVAQSMKMQKQYREKAAQEMQRAYNQGRQDITNMIIALNSYFDSEIQYSKSIGDYQIALNQYAALRDELIPEAVDQEKK